MNRAVSALVATVGLALFASACGGSPRTTTAATPSHLTEALAFSHCMRAHGVPSFPDPDSQANFPPFQTGVSKQISSAADESCKHLLSSGSSTATPQERQQKFAFALKVAECLRTHGYPDFPDPSSSGQKVPHDVDVSSPQFVAAQTTCEKQAKRALGLP